MFRVFENSFQKSFEKKCTVAVVILIAASGSAALAQSTNAPRDAFYLDLIETSTQASAGVSINSKDHSASDYQAAIDQLVGLTGSGSSSHSQANDPIGFDFTIPHLDSELSEFTPTLGTRMGSQAGTGNMNNTPFVTKEDPLNVVPLPPAAIAGLGMLAGIAGVRLLRRRK